MKSIKIFCDAPEYAPTRAHPTDAGLDLRAVKDYVICIGGTEFIDTGVHAEIDPGHVGIVALRSSMSKRDLRMSNSVGIIDSDYRGSIKIPLKNDGVRLERIEAGERIAQLLTIPCSTPEVELVASLDDLSETDRGTGGFGSTGSR